MSTSNDKIKSLLASEPKSLYKLFPVSKSKIDLQHISIKKPLNTTRMKPRSSLTEEKTFTVYPLTLITDFLKYLASINHKEYLKDTANPRLDIEQFKSQIKKYKFRFLITTNFELLFSPGGLADNNKIIPHSRITGMPIKKALCLAAGDIKLYPQNKIMVINNKSGDFKSNFDCLKFLLACLSFNQNEYFSQYETIYIHNYIDGTQVTKEIYQITKSELEKWAHDIFSRQIINKFCQQPQEVVVQSYLKDELNSSASEVGGNSENKEIDSTLKSPIATPSLTRYKNPRTPSTKRRLSFGFVDFSPPPISPENNVHTEEDSLALPIWGSIFKGVDSRKRAGAGLDNSPSKRFCSGSNM